MRIVAGAIILWFGIVFFGAAVSKAPPDAGNEFLLGYYLPSGGIIALGAAILAWGRTS